jgi:di/tricarboxylate transporter
MDLAWISLAALAVVIVVSCTTTVNPGFLAIVFAWVIGVYLGRPPIGLKGVAAGFPAELFLTLVGVTLFFAAAQGNGTLDRLARLAVRGCRGNTGLIPLAFFGLAFGIASIGAGNIASAALVAPLAMPAAARAGIPPFLMTLMVAHGAVAGALSPFSPTGIIARDLMAEQGLSGHTRWLYLANAIANVTVAALGYFLFGGWRLFGRRYEAAVADARPEPFGFTHVITLLSIAGLIVVVVGFRADVGMAALAMVVVLTLAGLADEKGAIKAIPWSVILMVCGVTVLTALLGKTGGRDRFTHLIAQVSTAHTVYGVVAFATGVVSVYSSTAGVVLPTFLPIVPGLVAKLGGGDPLSITASILIGGHLVDVSPLSTIGALCVACAPPDTDRRRLFNGVLAWGLSMAVIAALGCQVVFGR